MGEIIQIHIGQAGVQIGNACWELYCLEHGIGADGCLCDTVCDSKFHNFFACKEDGRVSPRTVLVDSEPTVVDQVRTGPYGQLYCPGSLITGKEDSGSNFARGYYTIGAELIDMTVEAIRCVAESCSNLRGFLLFRSIGGGTGSGLGNLIAEKLHDEYENTMKMEFIIFPSPSLSPLIVEPYNTMLATHLSMDFMDCTFIIENEALYDICSSSLNIMAPKYKNLNRMIGQIVSTFTTPHRFSGSGNISFLEIQTNLVPYPRIHFPVLSYAPFIPGVDRGGKHFTTEEITASCFEPSNQLVRCDPATGIYMSCVLMYRGNVSDWAINNGMTILRENQTIRFADWLPVGFKVSTNYEPPITVPSGGLGNSDLSLITMSNNTVIQLSWRRVLSKFKLLYSRRTFMHYFLEEGLDEAVMNGAYEDISALIQAYKEVESGAGVAGKKHKSKRSSQDDLSEVEVESEKKSLTNTVSKSDIEDSDYVENDESPDEYLKIKSRKDPSKRRLSRNHSKAELSSKEKSAEALSRERSPTPSIRSRTNSSTKIRNQKEKSLHGKSPSEHRLSRTHSNAELPSKEKSTNECQCSCSKAVQTSKERLPSKGKSAEVLSPERSPTPSRRSRTNSSTRIRNQKEKSLHGKSPSEHRLSRTHSNAELPSKEKSTNECQCSCSKSVSTSKERLPSKRKSADALSRERSPAPSIRSRTNSSKRIRKCSKEKSLQGTSPTHSNAELPSEKKSTNGCPCCQGCCAKAVQTSNERLPSKGKSAEVLSPERSPTPSRRSRTNPSTSIRKHSKKKSLHGKSPTHSNTELSSEKKSKNECQCCQGCCAKAVQTSKERLPSKGKSAEVLSPERSPSPIRSDSSGRSSPRKNSSTEIRKFPKEESLHDKSPRRRRLPKTNRKAELPSKKKSTNECQCCSGCCGKNVSNSPERHPSKKKSIGMLPCCASLCENLSQKMKKRKGSSKSSMRSDSTGRSTSRKNSSTKMKIFSWRKFRKSRSTSTLNRDNAQSHSRSPGPHGSKSCSSLKRSDKRNITPRLQLPTRSDDSLQKISKTFSCFDTVDTSCQRWKRSKSLEPCLEISRDQKVYTERDQLMDSEACRAKAVFSALHNTKRKSQACCPHDVLRLPPLSDYDLRGQSEAVTAKDRFCKSIGTSMSSFGQVNITPRASCRACRTGCHDSMTREPSLAIKSCGSETSIASDYNPHFSKNSFKKSSLMKIVCCKGTRCKRVCEKPSHHEPYNRDPITHTTCCKKRRHHSSCDRDSFLAACSSEERFPVYRKTICLKRPKRQKICQNCFCCNDDDDFRFFNSDECLVPLPCCPLEHVCFTRLNVCGNMYSPPTSCCYVQEEEVVCCPSRENICGNPHDVKISNSNTKATCKSKISKYKVKKNDK